MLSVNEQIKITKIGICGEDLFVLSQMYLPLIGIDSFSLFMILNTIKSKEKIVYVKKILDMMNITNVGILENAFNKLEAIGLVKRYYNESKASCRYLFEIQNPLDARSFINNPLLKNYLVSQIGEVEFKGLKSYVSKSSASGYKEVTKRFDEVYKTGDEKHMLFDNMLKKDLQDNIRVKNDKFDYTLFKLLFDTNFIDEAVFEDEEFTQEILRISYQYKLTEEEMKEAVIKAITIGQDLKYEDISKYAAYIYQNKDSDNKPLVFTAKEADVYVPEMNKELKDIIERFDNMSAADLLAEISGGKAVVSEIKNFEKIEKETKFPQGVINVLISYVVTNKNGEIPQYSYLEKIAKTWLRAGVKTTLDAINYINRPIEEKQPKTRSKKEMKTSEWVKEYADSVKEKDVNEISDEDIQKGLKAGSKLFG